MSAHEALLTPDMFRSYQHTIVDLIEENPNYGVFLRMGGGKTVSTLTAVKNLFQRFEIGKVLVISTVRNIRATWPNQIHAWSHTQDMSYSVIYGTPKQRLAALSADVDVYTINLENVVWLTQQYTVNSWPFDVVVIDESSKFKNPGTKRFKALKKFRAAINRMILLTGSPATKGLLNLWSQVFLLDGGQRLGKTYSAYKQRYFYPDWTGYNWTLREGAEERIYKEISDICITIDPTEYLDTREPVFNDVLIPLDDELKQKYKEFERDFLLELESGIVEAPNAAVLSSKLRQFCNGALYTDDRGTWKQIHELKINALEEIIEDADDMPVLVAYEFKFDRDRLLKHFPHATLLDTDPKTLERFNNGEIPILLMNPASGGHGLDLQHGTNIAVWFGMQWSLELYEQFNERMGPTRQAQSGYDRPAYYHHIMIADSVEQSVQQRLVDYSGDQTALLHALKQDISTRLEKNG
jgi:SNF2 family DNA or RNA helicase